MEQTTISPPEATRILEKYAHDDWDGEGASAVASVSVYRFVRFLTILGLVNHDQPQYTVVDDGSISAFWRDATSYVDLDFTTDGTVFYSINGDQTRRGKSALGDDVNLALLVAPFIGVDGKNVTETQRTVSGISEGFYSVHVTAYSSVTV